MSAEDHEFPERTNWCQSVGGVLLHDNRVLLTRHTYGPGKGKLIIPGGYVLKGESPEQALVREFLEETGIGVQPLGLLGVRFNPKDWYVVFLAAYRDGVPRSDGDENSEVLWMDAKQALLHGDVPDLSKLLIRRAVENGGLFRSTPYRSSIKADFTSLYTLLPD